MSSRGSLRPWERRVMVALFGCITPERGTSALSIEGSGALETCDVFLQGLPKLTRLVVRAVLFSVERLGMLLVFVPGRFSRMSSPRRDRFLHRLHRHPLYEVRVMARLVTALCYTAYYSRQEVACSLGYDLAARLRYARSEPNPEGRWLPGRSTQAHRETV